MNGNVCWRFCFLVTVVTAFVASGCAVGPNFEKPAPPPDSLAYTPSLPSATTSTTNVMGGESQRFVPGLDIPGEWWTLFHSKPLNDLIERALKVNPDLKAAHDALLVSQENVLAQRGAYYPSIEASASATRAKSSAELSPVPNNGNLSYSLYTSQVSVSYVPDVFGLNRRSVESLRAQEQEVRYQLIATHIALTANIVAAAIQEASLRGQIEATRDLIAINKNMVDILRKQLNKGYVSGLEVAAQESQLAQVSATLPPLLKQLGQQRDFLLALSGGFPSQALDDTFELSSMQLPQNLPLSLPSRLVEQRPDVKQAEENLHAASAQIGVAVANRFPNFTLTADVGAMALEISRLLTSGTGVWSLAGGVTQPIFGGGALLHKERAAKAAYVEAEEQYRSTVLTAFRNVADVLKALDQDDDALKAASTAKDAADTTLDLAKKQWQAGYVNYLALLSAEQTYQQAVITLVQAEANRYSDTSALFYALGGGWWNRTDIPKE